MAKKEHVSETPATQFLKQHKVAFVEHTYAYETHGGTTLAAQEMGADEHSVIKTLIMQDEHAKPLVVLMHGDCTVSTKNLARQIGCKTVEPCKPEVANRHSGFFVGGTSPFGTRKKMPVYMEESIVALPTIYINGGRRGFNISMNPQAILAILPVTLVHCALEKEDK